MASGKKFNILLYDGECLASSSIYSWLIRPVKLSNSSLSAQLWELVSLKSVCHGPNAVDVYNARSVGP